MEPAYNESWPTHYNFCSIKVAPSGEGTTLLAIISVAGTGPRNSEGSSYTGPYFISLIHYPATVMESS